MNRNVYIKQDPAKDTTASGLLYLPASVQDVEKPNTGTVVMTSPGTADEPVMYRKGDRVKFDPYAGQEMNIEGEDLRVLSDTDIYCKIKDLSAPLSGGSS